MMSFDTSILLAALESSAPKHAVARRFVESQNENGDVATCELVLLELYTLLRNPRVCARPLSGRDAASAIQALRHHPAWRVIDYVPEVVETMWEHAAQTSARLSVYDIRLALTLRHHNVTELATRNVKDFDGFGFTRVWDPLGDI